MYVQKNCMHVSLYVQRVNCYNFVYIINIMILIIIIIYSHAICMDTFDNLRACITD